MSRAGSQAQTALRLLRHLRPHWRSDVNLPRRIQTLLAGERAFGSRDRRLYRELIYTTLRFLPWIEPLLDTQPDEALRRLAHLAADTVATRPFRTAFAAGTSPTGDKTELLPAWFRAHCPEAFTPAQLDALLARAPLWIRTLDADTARIEARLTEDNIPVLARSPILPTAWRLTEDANVTQSTAYAEGLIEIQDLGSQLILASLGLAPRSRWLDACAGAGGKTLQLAALVGPAGHVTAHDIRAAALDELRTRAARARLANIAITATPTGTFDGVLVDAPCNGSGTWRRAPHLKWVTTEADIAAAAAQQSALLARFATHVRPGGQLVYATCSLSSQENEQVISGFLAARPDFAPVSPPHTFGFIARGHGITILPAQHDTDGFFFAVLRRH
jgi:16S rRNA (cytosine967-C5)-methyltransferase